MSQNKSSLLLILGILAVLVLAAVVLFTFRPDEQKLTRTARGGETSATTNSLLEQLKTQEILGTANAEEEGQPVFPEEAGTVRAPSVYESDFQSPENIRRFKNSRAAVKKFPSSSVGTQAAADSGLYEQAAYQAAGRTSGSRPGRSPAAGGKTGFAPVYSSGMSNEKNADKSPFSPYLAALTKEQAASLNKQLDGLTDRVQAAVLRALLPKSKKDTNIEKYLARHQGTDEPGAVSVQTSDKFAPVARQISRQKAGIVKSMQSAFGDKAAHQAGQIMDSYQKELSDVLNNASLTPEQVQQKTQEISQKYNDKLQKLSEKSGLEKIKQEQQTRDEAMQRSLATAYGGELASKMDAVLAQYRQNELDLVQQRGLSAEEFFKQQLENDVNRQKAIEKLLLENGQPLGPYHKLRERQQKEWLAKQKEREENGEILPVAAQYSDKQQADYNKQVFDDTEKVLAGVQQTFGEPARQELIPIVDKYREDVAKIMADPDTSVDEKNTLLLKANQEMNNQRKEKVVNMQVEKQLGDMFNNPEFAEVPPHERAEFEQHARPVLHEMFGRANDIMENPDLNEEQKKQQLQQVQEEAMRQLFGQ